MKRSTERVLTTHVGSLARPHDLLATMTAREHGEPYDAELYERQVRAAVADAVRRQAEAGLDVVSDGEQGKVSFFGYVGERLGGVELQEGGTTLAPSWQREVDMFPDYYRAYFGKYATDVTPRAVLVCTGPVTYVGHEAVKRDLETLEAALGDVRCEEAFLPATSPGLVGGNEFYATEEEYVDAVAEAMREEYLAITGAGILLQVDDPWLIELLAEGAWSNAGNGRAERHVETLNHALRGIPAEQVRYHTCYGVNHGPRLHDVPFADVVDLMLAVNAGAYSFEAANPRHQHEWRVWDTVRLPEGKILLPGLVSHATNFVEHPRGIADGIVTYARRVGRENVIASTDCGFSSRATFTPEVDPTVAWAKLAALAEGARLASEELW